MSNTCFSVESMDDDGVARRVEVFRDQDGNYCVSILTMWEPDVDPVVTHLALSQQAISLLAQLLNYLLLNRPIP